MSSLIALFRGLEKKTKRNMVAARFCCCGLKTTDRQRRTAAGEITGVAGQPGNNNAEEHHVIRDLFAPLPLPQAVGILGFWVDPVAVGAIVGHMSSRRQCRRQLQFFACPLAALQSPYLPSVYLATSPPNFNPTPTRVHRAHHHHSYSLLSPNTHQIQSEAAASCSELPTMKVTFKVGLPPPHRVGRE